jgi:hypothetical protein
VSLTRQDADPAEDLVGVELLAEVEDEAEVVVLLQKV